MWQKKTSRKIYGEVEAGTEKAMKIQKRKQEKEIKRKIKLRKQKLIKYGNLWLDLREHF